MRQRCSNPNTNGYKRYGGRGIKVCSRWLGSDGFGNFFSDMGERPEGMTIDRIDGDGPYTPDNCRWADRITQDRNRKTAVILTHDGQSLMVSEWARNLGGHRNLIYRRLKAGWSVEKTLTTKSRAG